MPSSWNPLRLSGEKLPWFAKFQFAWKLDRIEALFVIWKKINNIIFNKDPKYRILFLAERVAMFVNLSLQITVQI
jgi:hypothetical protein